jgi:hypothetical protein
VTHRVVRIIASSLAAGLMLGVAGRILMRIVVLQSGTPGGFSIGGTAEVVAFGMLLGTPVSTVFWLLRPLVRIHRPLAGLLLGVVVVAGLALAPPPSARSAMAAVPDDPFATLLQFAVLVVGWGVALDAVNPWVTRDRPIGG